MTPNPIAEVADNDLAIGRIISTITHSKFWKDSLVMVVEDDAQNGVDHVDGHRAPLLIASPYAKRGIVDNTYYSQLNVVKTIEQILGIAPMNQEDRAASPIFDAFTNTPNYTPYTVLPNQIPLTQGLTPGGQSGKLVPASPAQQGIPAAGPRDLRAVGGVEPERPVQRQGRHPGLGQPGPAQPAGLVQRPRLEGALPGRQERSWPPSEVPGANLPAGYLGD